MAAKKLKIDPAKLRLLNMIDKKDLPFKIGSGIVWDKAGFKECLKSALKLIDYKELRKSQKKNKCKLARNWYCFIWRVNWYWFKNFNCTWHAS